MGKVTELIQALHSGKAETSEEASEELYELIYGHLRAIARKKMASETPAHTLQPTALVNEVYLKLLDQQATSWRDRRHFFGVAAEAMRRILIDSARKKKRIKRGGNLNREVFSDSCIAAIPVKNEWLDLDEALRELEIQAPEKAELVKLRFFSGLTIEECAEALNISVSTVERSWRFSRAWLKSRMSDDRSTKSLSREKS